MSIKLGSIPDPRMDIESIYETVAALKRVVEVHARLRGETSVLAGAPTFQDLIDMGVITPDQVPRR